MKNSTKHVFTEENDNNISKDLLERIRRLEEKTDKQQQKAEEEEEKKGISENDKKFKEMEAERNFYRDLCYEYQDNWENHASQFPKTESKMKKLKQQLDEKNVKEQATLFSNKSVLYLFAIEKSASFDSRKLFCFLKENKIDINTCYFNTNKVHKATDGPIYNFPDGVVDKVKKFLSSYHQKNDDQSISAYFTELRPQMKGYESDLSLYRYFLCFLCHFS